jgi:hypothetical protein
LFEDDTFPAGNSALFWNDYISDESLKKFYEEKVTAWKRPSEIDGVVPGAVPSLFGS